MLEAAGSNAAGLDIPQVLGIIFNRVRYLTGGTGDEDGIMAQI